MSTSVPHSITTKDVCLWYAKFQALINVTVNIKHGLITSLIGPSGCGKTTLLRMIAGFIQPDHGDIAIGGRSMAGVAPNRRPVADPYYQFRVLYTGTAIAAGWKDLVVSEAAAAQQASRGTIR